jgi:hypothetical protein
MGVGVEEPIKSFDRTVRLSVCSENQKPLGCLERFDYYATTWFAKKHSVRRSSNSLQTGDADRPGLAKRPSIRRRSNWARELAAQAERPAPKLTTQIEGRPSRPSVRRRSNRAAERPSIRRRSNWVPKLAAPKLTTQIEGSSSVRRGSNRAANRPAFAKRSHWPNNRRHWFPIGQTVVDNKRQRA